MVDLLLKTTSSSTRLGSAPIYTGTSFVFYLTLFAFFVALASYGGLFILNKRLESTQQGLTEQVQAKESDLGDEAVKNILKLNSQLQNLRTVLATHIFFSNILRLLENETYPQVRFSNLAFSANAGRIDMSGETTSFSQLTRQISRLEQNPQIEKVEFGGLSRGDKNLVNFKLTVTFKPALLRAPAGVLSSQSSESLSAPSPNP